MDADQRKLASALDKPVATASSKSAPTKPSTAKPPVSAAAPASAAVAASVAPAPAPVPLVRSGAAATHTHAVAAAPAVAPPSPASEDDAPTPSPDSKKKPEDVPQIAAADIVADEDDPELLALTRSEFEKLQQQQADGTLPVSARHKRAVESKAKPKDKVTKAAPKPAAKPKKSSLKPAKPSRHSRDEDDDDDDIEDDDDDDGESEDDVPPPLAKRPTTASSKQGMSSAVRSAATTERTRLKEVLRHHIKRGQEVADPAARVFSEMLISFYTKVLGNFDERFEAFLKPSTPADKRR